MLKLEQITSRMCIILFNPSFSANLFSGRTWKLLQSIFVSVVGNESRTIFLKTTYDISAKWRTVLIELYCVCLCVPQWHATVWFVWPTSIFALPFATSVMIGTLSFSTSGRGFSGYGVWLDRGVDDKQTTCWYVSTPPFARMSPFRSSLVLNFLTISIKACHGLSLCLHENKGLFINIHAWNSYYQHPQKKSSRPIEWSACFD